MADAEDGRVARTPMAAASEARKPMTAAASALVTVVPTVGTTITGVLADEERLVAWLLVGTADADDGRGTADGVAIAGMLMVAVLVVG